MKLVLKILIYCILISCIACSRESIKQDPHIYVVTAEPIQHNLFFTGNIQPLQETTLTSPLDATIETIYYHYGQYVTKDQLIMVLNSQELQKQYSETLAEYLKAKDNYTMTKAKFTGIQELWKSGLLSRNNYLSEKSSLDMASMNLIQTNRKLHEMLAKIDDHDADHELSALKIAEIDKVQQALTTDHHLIKLKAPAEGILLYPPKTANDDKTSKLKVGSAIKSNQVIALVGDLSGISIEIDISEVDLNKIYIGMPAIITGVAFGKEVLHGKLVALNGQASTVQNNTLPSFNGLIEVKQLTPAQRKVIKVGMSASITLQVNTQQQLLIPITAVKRDLERSIVMLQAQNGSLYPQVISTGTSLADKVVVTSGLKVGDKVIYD